MKDLKHFKYLLLTAILLISSNLASQHPNEFFATCYNSFGCVVDSDITIVSGALPAELPDGPAVVIGDGEVVEICYEVSTYVGLGVNWLHGIAVELGPAWEPLNASSSISDPGGGASGVGSWDWYDYSDNCSQGPCGSPGNNKWGWWYESSLGAGCGAMGSDNDASNNFGDWSPSNNFSWNFCLELVSQCPQNVTANTDVSFRVWSDSESGTKSTCGCEGGTIECSIPITVSCCQPINISDMQSNVVCNSDLTTLFVTGDTTNPNYIFDYQGPDGPGPQGPNQGAWNFNPGEASPGLYTLTVTDMSQPNCQKYSFIYIFDNISLTEFSVPTICLGSPDPIFVYPDVQLNQTNAGFVGPFCTLPGVSCNLIDQFGDYYVQILPGSLPMSLAGTTQTLTHFKSSDIGCFSVHNVDITFDASPNVPSVVPPEIIVCGDNDFPGLNISPNEGWEYHWYQIPSYGVSQAEIATGTTSLTEWPNFIDTNFSPGDSYSIFVTAVNQASGCPGPWAEVEITVEDLQNCADCPQFPANIGDVCDDGNPNTGFDLVQANCTCVGVPVDCLGIANGNATIGSACDDGDPLTVADVYLNDCSCQGELVDCNGVVGGMALPGSPCPDQVGQINSTWDSNCECVGESSSTNLAISVFLEGYTMDDGTMRTTLAENNLLPLSQPYDTAPYFYTGSESVNQHNNDIVDWVLVELGDPLNPDVLVERKALRLRSDGTVVDELDNGLLGWQHSGSYYVVIRHRSHLAIQSAIPIDFQNTNDFQFNSSINQGTGNMQQVLVHGQAAMIAGDYDQSGTINFADFVQWLQVNNELSAYASPDGSGDSVVNFWDFIFWLKNQNIVGAAPTP